MIWDKLHSWKRSPNAAQVARNAEQTSDGFWDLGKAEIWWRDRQQMLESHGYLLRPRFRPGWTPSWLGTDKLPDTCEDSISMKHSEVIDAVRATNGMKVVIKRVPLRSKEVKVLEFLTSSDKLQSAANHCVPLLDVFEDATEPRFTFIVMPLLRRYNNPPFFTVGEVIDFMQQAIEGLTFIHAQDVAHRDCSTGNLMMDGDPLFPAGFHPSDHELVPSGARPAKFLRRSDVAQVKYFFIDFGISVRYVDPSEPRLVLGIDGQDESVPELSDRTPYNPFAVDVFILGNMFETDLIWRYRNLRFLLPLTKAMIQHDPTSRPTAAEVLKQFAALTSGMKGSETRWRLQPIIESRAKGVYNDALAYAREGFFLLRAGNSKVLSYFSWNPSPQDSHISQTSGLC